MSIIHSGSMSCFANHFRASAAFSFEAPSTSRFSCEEDSAISVSSGSGSGLECGSDSGSDEVWEGREKAALAKKRAWC